MRKAIEIESFMKIKDTEQISGHKTENNVHNQANIFSYSELIITTAYESIARNDSDSEKIEFSSTKRSSQKFIRWSNK